MELFNIEDDVFLFESEAESKAREIRTQQNELVLIARLPPEILADIFVRCVPTTVHKLDTRLRWLNVTRVSSQWRNIALACPDFWSTPIFSRPKWTPVMLARSKMASLVARVDLIENPTTSPEPILLENASRLSTLDIHTSQSQLTTFMANLEHADAAPRLQDIRIVNIDMGNLGEGGMWLPGDLFRRTEVLESRKMGTQPGVRLHLESCAFPWDSGWYSHLAHFRLENIHPAQRPTMETFLAILIGSPNLETLAVIRSCPATPGFTVQLPRLTSLTIDDSSSLCEHLLRFLVVPPTAIIDIACTIPADIPKDTPLTEIVYQALIPAFSEYTSAGMYDTVCINYKNGFACSLHHSARPDWSRKVKIDAASWARKGWLSALRATEAVRDHLDFSNVTTLHLHYMPKLPLPRTPDFFRFHSTLSLWDTMGRKLTGVHTLHLHKSYIGSWLEFMLTQAMLLVGVSHHNSCFNIPASPHGLAFRGPDGALTHAWAGLRCLALHNIDLDVRRHRTGPRRGEMLRALLWARRMGGAPILQLDIEDCPDCWCPDCVPFRLFADVLDGGGEQKQEDTKETEFLRSYSIDIFTQVVQDDRPLVRDGVRIESPDWVAGSSIHG